MRTLSFSLSIGRRGLLPLLLLLALRGAAQLPPVVTSWLINTNGATGYSGIAANVQQVRYSTGSVYVSCTGIPAYTIGPWAMNPNIPANQNYTFKIIRTPTPSTGAGTATQLGAIGLWRNGVTMFNAKDARSYQNRDVWHQNAIVVEGPGFDACEGHPAPGGAYHHHLNPTCLYNDHDSTAHAPILGYANDGYPVYGTYGYRNASGMGGIKSMRSSYRLRNITQRTTLPGGTAASSAGPVVSTQYPLGYYVEDFEYVAGSGDLDAHNGRFCVTPEYPAGTYAYFVTLNSLYEGAYPYVLGPNYYGVVSPGMAGHAIVNEPVTTYVLANRLAEAGFGLSCAPNPVSTSLTVQLTGPASAQPFQARLLNTLGQAVGTAATLHPGSPLALDLSGLANGIYFLWLEGNGLATAQKLVVAH